MLSYILAIVCGVVCLVADQLTKWIVNSNMELNSTKPFINGFIEFWYIHNEGGAWGFLQGYTWILVSFTIVIMIVCFAMLIKHGLKNKVLFWAFSLIFSGGIGNLIDRLLRGGKVIDFLNFQFIDFPVFNIADCAIVIGSGLLMIYFIREIIQENKQRYFDK